MDEMRKIRLKLLRDSCRRIASASEWAKSAGLLNVSAELRQAQKDIEGFLKDETP